MSGKVSRRPNNSNGGGQFHGRKSGFETEVLDNCSNIGKPQGVNALIFVPVRPDRGAPARKF
jgi:hypothetical protein